MNARTLLAAASLPAVLWLSHCTPYQQQGAMIGGLAGGALGALAGDSGSDVARGVAIGAAAGTGIAAIDESARRNTPPPGTTAAPPQQGYPIARRTSSRNQVISPYSPYNVIDITGFRSGDLARDPTNGRIFRVP